ncbi:MAG TPA: SDR family NAD(P)-dependent oxidoreductase [Pseudobdellovibrionaceae bacterium]|jgi:nucleoside-diphosphate-sugar epimerase
MRNMKKVLVTGVAGFIANRVAESLLAEGVEVVGIDNLNDYYDVRLKNYRLEQLQGKKGFQFLKMDIENREDLRDLFDKHQFDVVFNLAARAGVRYSMENPHVYMTTNAMGSLNLLEEMKRKNIKKFILASTSSLYAGQKMPFSEDLAVNIPISPYAASKKAAEVMAYSYHYLFGIDVSIVRYFTVFGPAGRPDMSIFRFIKWIDQGDRLEVFGDGAQSRDFTFVEDIARGTILASKELGYEVINLGGGQNPISLNTVIAGIENRLGKKAAIDNRVFHAADIKETWADISKAKRLLGWEPKISFEEGLEKTIQWYLQNKSWLKDIQL